MRHGYYSLRTLFFICFSVLVCSLSNEAFAGKNHGLNALGRGAAEPRATLFEENKGQLKDQFGKSRLDVKYYGQTEGMNFYVQNTGLSYQLSTVVSWKKQESDRLEPIPGEEESMVADQIRTHRVDLNWLGANVDILIEEGEKSLHYTNYYNVPEDEQPALYVRQYSSIRLKNVYDKIDLHCYGTNGNLETDWLVSPGADYRQIRMEIRGAELAVDEQGRLVMTTPLGEIREGALKVFQDNDRISAKWVIAELPDGALGGIVSFDIPDYDSERALRIDPLVDVFRRWATYYGGSSMDYTIGSAVDQSGNVFVSGVSQSTSDIASGGHQDIHAPGDYDAFLVKFDTDGARLWATYYGGSSYDYGNACATDTSGNVYMGGATRSGVAIASGGFQNTFSGGDYDGFLAKFNADGIRQWGTYYGSTEYTTVSSCATDNYGHVYISGTTKSASGIAFEGHDNVFTGSNGAYDVYLAQFNSDGSRNWGTYYGGTGSDSDASCTVDKNGNVYMLGRTKSTSAIAYNGFRNSYNGGEDLFLVKFDSIGVRQWATYYGSTGDEYTGECVTDTANNVYISGMASAASTNLAWQGFQNQHAGDYDALLVKFNEDGARQWATYYGTWAYESGDAVSVDGAGNVYLSGRTESLSGLGVGSDQLVSGGTRDGYLVKFNASGSRQWSTYYGGEDWELISSSAVDANGNIYLTGYTRSTTGVSMNGHQNVFGGGTWDAFLVKFFGSCVPLTNDHALSELTCFGDETASITFIPDGGTNPLEYSVDGGNNYQSINEFDSLGSGTYDLYIKDFNGCKTAGETVVIVEPTQVTFNSFVTNNPCPNGSAATISVIATGGAGNYQYSADSAATFQTQSVITGLTSGIHEVGVRDFNGCVSEIQQITISEPPALNVGFTVVDPLCFGTNTGIVVVAASGGTGSLQYSLNAGSYYPSTLFTGLVAGTYDVIVKDAANCESSHTITLNQPDQIIVNSVVENVECRNASNGSIVLTVSGGVPGYQYNWTPQVSNSEEASALPADNYSITVVDTNNCSQITNVTVTEPAPLEAPICLVTVDSTSSFNIVVWEKPFSAEIDSFFIYREVMLETYERIGALPYAADGRFDDNDANPNVTSYRYRLSALDTCGVESPLSPFHNTIHLQQLGNGNLLWSHYAIENQPNPVQYYRVYRDDNSTGDFQSISNTIPGGNNSYTDLAYSTYPNASYLVDVAWNLSCDPSRSITTTQSNRYLGQVPVGINSASSLDFLLFPNPTTFNVTLVLPEHVGPQSMSLLNALGQEVLKGTVVGGSNTVVIDGLAHGMYIFRVGSQIKKLVVE